MLYALFSLLGLGLLALDQWVKAWTVGAFAAPVPPLTATADPSRTLLPGILGLTRVHNYGAAWSSFSGQRWLLLAVTGAIVAAVFFVLARRIVRHPLGIFAGTLIIAGGCGNILDRLRLGYVVDMLEVQFIDYPVFNVADCCIVTGCLLAVVYDLWFYEKYDKRRPSHGDEDSAGRP